MRLYELTSFLDEYLAIHECPDASLNGLQVEGGDTVEKIALAVDACSETFRKAAALKADMLLTHHGIFWGKVYPVTGIHADRFRILLENELSLYAAHLPLDIHPVVGNNAGLIRLLGFKPGDAIGEYKGIKIGYTGTVGTPMSYRDFIALIGDKLKVTPLEYKFGGDNVRRIAVITGSGASAIEEAAGTDIDLFLTGEISHPGYHAAKEIGVNLVFAGHYATETIGVKLLGDVITEKFGVETVFIDVPTGM